MTWIDTAGKILPPRYAARLAPVFERLVQLATANDETSAAQRMAMIAFAIRIVSAAIAFASQIILARLMGEFEYGVFVFVWVIAVILGARSYREGKVFFWDEKNRKETDVDPGWSDQWIARSRAHGPAPGPLRAGRPCARGGSCPRRTRHRCR